MVKQSALFKTLGLTLALFTTTQAHAFVNDAVASYYGARFHGRLTASGERFNMHRLTAAHRTLKFGTRVIVTNKANGRSIEVTINDRGPYVKGRSIDLSRGAAEELGMLHDGVATVEISVVGSSAPVSKDPAQVSSAQAQRMLMELF